MTDDPHPGKPATRGRYNYGCRCVGCRAANVAYHRSLRSRLATRHADPACPHGTPGGYRNWLCRCRPCTEANTVACKPYILAYRARQRGNVQTN